MKPKGGERVRKYLRKYLVGLVVIFVSFALAAKVYSQADVIREKIENCISDEKYCHNMECREIGEQDIWDLYDGTYQQKVVYDCYRVIPGISEESLGYWAKWTHRCPICGNYHEMARRVNYTAEVTWAPLKSVKKAPKKPLAKKTKKKK